MGRGIPNFPSPVFDVGHIPLYGRAIQQLPGVAPDTVARGMPAALMLMVPRSRICVAKPSQAAHPGAISKASQGSHLPCPAWGLERERQSKSPQKERGKGKKLVNPWEVSREAAPAAARNTNVVSVW